MKSRLSFTGALLLLLSLTSVALGQKEFQIEGLPNEPWVSEVICQENRRAVGWIGDHAILLCFKFEESMLQPPPDGTNSHIEVLIISYMKKGVRNLTALDIVAVSPEDNPGLIIEKAEPQGPERSSTLSSARVFRVPIQITKQARSKKYPITALVTSGTAKQSISFSLPILAPETAQIEVEKKPNALVDCWTGSNCSPLELVIRNKLPYKLTISNISITSEDLLYKETNGEYPREISNSSPFDLPVPIKAKPITLSRVFSGFGAPQATITIEYKDEFGRPIFTKTTADLQIRPNVLIIAALLILGAAFGTFARRDLRGLERKRIITRGQRIRVAATTFATGIVVCIIALFANIKLIVWSDQNSYSAWEPKVLFFTAVVATVNGLPILYAYLKLQRQSKETSPQPEDNPHDANA